MSVVMGFFLQVNNWVLNEFFIVFIRMLENGYFIFDSNFVKKMRFVIKLFNFDFSMIIGLMFFVMFE